MSSSAPNHSVSPGKAAIVSSPQNGRRGRNNQEFNHLLGFTLPPRAPPPPSGPRRSAKRSNGTHGAYDKQRYVHQFRFVLKPDKDYTAHFADPDIHFEWSDILQVIVPTSSALASASTSTIDQQVENRQQGGAVPTCPICLSEPTAARMTRCGHCFCYPCLLHYLELADGTKWRKCPVCWDAIYAKDLKAVKWLDPVSFTNSTSFSPPATLPIEAPSPPHSLHQHPTDPNREKLKMRLVRRPQLTTLALPRSSTWPSEAVPPLGAPWQFTPDAMAYAKFMLGAPDYLKDELELDLKELEREIVNLRRWGVTGGTDEELGIVFVQSAIKKVKEQLEKVEGLKTHTVMTARKKSLRELQSIRDGEGKRVEMPLPVVSETSSSEVEENVEIPSDFLSTRSAGGATTPIAFSPSLTQQQRNMQSRRPNQTHTDFNTAYYFYQAASGQNIFLQPLDIKILKSSFGTYEGMPDTIEILVDGFDEGTMNEELRRRCKWLSHLPKGADVVFIEADLSPVVSDKNLEPYNTALKTRRNKRRDKVRREDKAKLKSELKEQEKRPIYTQSSQWVPDPTIDLPYLPSHNPATNAAFPPPPQQDVHDVAPPATFNSSSEGRTVWGTRSFASALHSSSRDAGAYQRDDDFDDRWHDFEDKLVGGGGAVGGGGSWRRGSGSGSNSGGGGARGDQTPPASTGGRGKKKGKKLVLNLTGAGQRGTG